MNTTDFYEEDEDPEELVQVFEQGRNVVTASPTDEPGGTEEPGGSNGVPRQQADRESRWPRDLPLQVELEAIQCAIVDPGAFTRRLGVDVNHINLDDYEPEEAWQARAALIARNRAVHNYVVRHGSGEYLAGKVVTHPSHVENMIDGTVLRSLPDRTNENELLVLAWRVVTTDHWAVTGHRELYSSAGLFALSAEWEVVATLVLED